MPYFIITIINGKYRAARVSMDSIKDLTAVDVLDEIIIDINTITKNKNRPDESSIYEILNKNHDNANLTKITMNERLTFMSNNNRITNKLNNEKNCYFETNEESSEQKDNIENQILTGTEMPTPKKVQLQIYWISWKTYRTSSSMNFWM